MWPLPRGGGGSGGCAHGGNMSSRPTARPCPQPSTTVSTRWRLARSTTPYGDRRRTGRGRGRCLLRRCPRGRGQSRSVTWLPWGLSSPHRCWRTLLLKQWTPARLGSSPRRLLPGRRRRKAEERGGEAAGGEARGEDQAAQ